MEAELSCCVKDSGAWDGYSDVVENVYYSGSDLCSGSTLFLLCRTLIKSTQRIDQPPTPFCLKKRESDLSAELTVI